MRRGACTAQIVFVIARHAPACKVGCKIDIGCETALRAVRDGLIGRGARGSWCDALFELRNVSEYDESGSKRREGGHRGYALRFRLSSVCRCFPLQ